MLAGRLVLLLCALSLTSSAKTIEIPLNIFGNGVSFDEIQFFVETPGLQLDTRSPVAFDADSPFAQWYFDTQTTTYLVGTGPETIGSKLTLALSATSSGAVSETVTVRVYLSRQGRIVGAYDVTVAPSGFTVTPVSTDLAALQLAEQQAFTVDGVPPPDPSTPPGQQTGGGDTTPPALGDTTAAFQDVPEPGSAGLLAGAFIALAGLRRASRA